MCHKEKSQTPRPRSQMVIPNQVLKNQVIVILQIFYSAQRCLHPLDG